MILLLGLAKDQRGRLASDMGGGGGTRSFFPNQGRIRGIGRFAVLSLLCICQKEPHLIFYLRNPVLSAYELSYKTKQHCTVLTQQPCLPVIEPFAQCHGGGSCQTGESVPGIRSLSTCTSYLVVLQAPRHLCNRGKVDGDRTWV